MAELSRPPARRVDQRRLADTRPTLDHEHRTAALQQLLDRRQLAFALEQVLHDTTLSRCGGICATTADSVTHGIACRHPVWPAAGREESK